MLALSIIAIALAAVAFVGVGGAWIFSIRVRKRVSQLERRIFLWEEASKAQRGETEEYNFEQQTSIPAESPSPDKSLTVIEAAQPAPAVPTTLRDESTRPSSPSGGLGLGTMLRPIAVFLSLGILGYELLRRR